MLADSISLEALSCQPHPPTVYRVELHALDGGWYMVRLHHGNGVADLVDETGAAMRFSGVQWAGRALTPLGFTEAVLTHFDTHDEMIGSPTTTVSPEKRLAFGVRVSFQT